MSQTSQVQSKGIFHGLPVYSESEGLQAVICGANGISGHYMLRVLSQSPKRWRKIYCLSRRPPTIKDGLPENAEHIPLDFLKTPEEVAQTLKDRNVKADHVFFFSYIQPAPKPGQGLWSDAEEMTQINSALLSNFLEAMKLASVQPKRFMLQTGAKNYGMHLGPTKLPQEESDPRVELEPNFYYSQEDMLFKYCRMTGCKWNVCMPGPITGAVPDAAMNYAYPLAVYASVCKKLGEPLDFPGDFDSWQMPQSMSYAMMNAYLEEWAVLSGPPNEKYNACDNSAFTWEAVWPKVASWYGVESKRPQEGNQYTEMTTPFNPRGYGPKGTARQNFSMVDWAKRPEVQTGWKTLANEHGLSMPEESEYDRIFGFLNGALVRPAPSFVSMDKSRKLGWHGFVDSSEALLETFEDLAKLRMVPPF